MLDPRLRLGLKQRAMVTEMLEMGWLFTTVVRYNQSVDGEEDMDSLPLTLIRCHCLPRHPTETEVQDGLYHVNVMLSWKSVVGSLSVIVAVQVIK